MLGLTIVLEWCWLCSVMQLSLQVLSPPRGGAAFAAVDVAPVVLLLLRLVDVEDVTGM